MSPKEELANTVTHGFGLCFSMIGFIFLMIAATQQGDFWSIFSCAVYGSTLVVLYAASTFYHAFQSERVKHILRIADHCAIYLLIAGTYTPFTLISLQGTLGWTIFGVVWGLAVIGMILKVLFFDRFELFSTLLYIAMGWLVLIAIEELVVSLSYEGLAWLIAGGISYSAGIIFYVKEQWRFSHAIWHLFVLGGSTCHYIAVFLYVLPIG